MDEDLGAPSMGGKTRTARFISVNENGLAEFRPTVKLTSEGSFASAESRRSFEKSASVISAGRRRSTTMFGSSPIPTSMRDHSSISGVGGLLMAKRASSLRAQSGVAKPIIVTQTDGSRQLASFSFLHRLAPRTQFPSFSNWDDVGRSLQFTPLSLSTRPSGEFSVSQPSPDDLLSPSQQLQPTSFRPQPVVQDPATDVFALAHPVAKTFISPVITRRETKPIGRRDVENVFQRLRREHLNSKSDAPSEIELARRDRHRSKKSEHVVKGVFLPMCRVLEELWGHYHVGREEQRAFSEKFFFPITHENYLIVSSEVVSYTSKGVSAGHDLVHLVSLRETLLRALAAVTSNPAVVEAPTLFESDGIVARIFNLILVLRQVTCHIVDVIHAQRQANNDTAPLMWEGKNYTMKMQDDLGFLADGYISIIAPKLRCRANPMLLPNKYFPEVVVRQPRAATTGKKQRVNTSDAQQITPLSPRASSKPNMTTLPDATALSNVVKSATTPTKSPQRMSRTHRLHSASSSDDSGGAGGIAQYVPSICLPAKKEPPVVLLRDGEVVDQKSRPTSRQEYFTRLQREEYLEAHKVPMDRTNVYRYPASVYQPKPVPHWEVTGARLERSLDPEIQSVPFNENEQSKSIYAFAESKLPPQFSQAKESALIDAATGCYRPAASTRLYSITELHQREVLLLAENNLRKTEGMRKKRHRAFMKFRVAFRGFISMLRRYRAMKQQQLAASSRTMDVIASASTADAQPSSAAVKGFQGWLLEHAPRWHSRATQLLCQPHGDIFTNSDDDEPA